MKMLLALLLAGASATAPTPPIDYLITAAASDFHAHPVANSVRFRNVHVGHVANGEGTNQYMLCGEFQPVEKKGGAGWTPFATIKTSRYEQWLGDQAATLCQRPSITWDGHEDLSPMLQRRIDSSQKG
jgi:hypothetical protein